MDESGWHDRVAGARALLTLFVAALCISLGGCKGCDVGDDNATQGLTCPEVPCRSTERCVEGVCLGLTDVICIGGCDEGEICQLGECIPGVEVCQQAGQTCDVTMPVSGDFYCIDWDGFTTGDPAVCSSPCQPGLVCGEGETCFVLTGLGEQSCGSDAECSAGEACRGGICEATACQPSECFGFLDGLEECARKYGDSAEFPRGATCQSLPDDTSFCFAAGERQVGESCVDFIDGLIAEDLSATCGVGLACVQGVCQVACQEGDGGATMCDLQAGESCLFAESDFVASGVGFCGASCTPFSTGECGDAGKCLPLDAERGYCVPAGEIEPFESCVVGAWECEEGNSCVPTGDGGRCLPLCNTTVSPADPEAQVGPRDQLLRDETCPQPIDQAQGYVRLVHPLMEGARGYDIYLDRDTTPWISGLEPGEIVQPDGGEFWVVLPGTHLLEFVPAGEPFLDAPVADMTIDVRRDQVTEVVLRAPDVGSSREVALVSRELPRATQAPLALWHLVPDVSRVKVAVVDGNDNIVSGLGWLLEEDVLAIDVPVPAMGAIVLLGEGDEELGRVRVGPSSLERVLYWTGTREPDDAWPLAITGFGLGARPEELPPPPRMLCNDLNNGAFGYCLQSCRGAVDYGPNRDDVCQGDDMGCYPLRLPGLLGYRSVCQPQGGGREGERCNPWSQQNECASGLYCLEYGSGDPGVMAGEARGVCTRLCGTDEEAGVGELVCGAGQICQPIDEATLDVGQCGQACEPDGSYRDLSCPQGLRSCKPAAVLMEDTSGAGDAAPVVVELDEVCSASGSIDEGEACPGVDCAPGLECIYPRNAQDDLVSTLLSPYFGRTDLTATCRAYCDPFDELRASRRCGMGETCLVNFPWSADVGHCAPVVEEVEPFQACSRPGESCGEDSVCVIDGGTPFCLRLCEYSGGSSAMSFDQSTCPGGFECAPLVNDIGFCQ